MPVPPKIPANFANAVDLSSLGKPKVEAPTTMPGIEITAANLSSEILPLSKIKPVILICWSPRSPESLEVVKALAVLHGKYEGAWELGTVNADTETQVAQALQLQAIPYALAMIGEQVVPLFDKPFPEAQLKLVIDKVLELAAQQGIGSVPEEKLEPEEEAAMAALEKSDFATAEAEYKKLLNRKPGDSYGKLGLAQVQLMMRVASLDAGEVAAKAAINPNDVAVQIQCADFEIVNGDVESAFNRLLRCVKNLSGDERSAAKDHLLNLFALVDSADPRLMKARSELASALF